MTGPVTINAHTRGYDALMATLIGARTVQAASFQARVANRIQTLQNGATASPNQPRSTR
jgi:hypothetical protein